MNENKVILVDENDIQTGIAEKLEVHEKALLHRAVSVFLINTSGDWILQKRAFDKYHSNGLWTNACCTHPQPGESVFEAAKRRLREEMGINCTITWLFSFMYKEKLDNRLTENELDHVFFGITDNEPVINTSEVEEWKRISYADLGIDIASSPEKYTFWFREIYERVNRQIDKIRNDL
jgi:isopentenyl-diphosphate Delta-isomerase